MSAGTLSSSGTPGDSLGAQASAASMQGAPSLAQATSPSKQDAPAHASNGSDGPAAPLPLIAFADLPLDRGRHVLREGLDLAVFRVGDEAFAIDDSCPHQGASLAAGKLSGTRVNCPAHGLGFDVRTGACVAAPTLCSPRHVVRVVDGMVVLVRDAG